MRWIGQVPTSKSWLDGTDTHDTSARVRAHTRRLTQLLSQLAGPSQALLMVAQCGKSKLIYKILVVRAGIRTGRAGLPRRATCASPAQGDRAGRSQGDRAGRPRRAMESAQGDRAFHFTLCG